MSGDVNLSEIFGGFAGHEALDPGRVRQDMDPAIMALMSRAQEHGLSLRVHFPGGREADYSTNGLAHDTTRVNAYIQRGGPSGWRIADRFDLG
jgi:hypothetical protein